MPKWDPTMHKTSVSAAMSEIRHMWSVNRVLELKTQTCTKFVTDCTSFSCWSVKDKATVVKQWPVKE